MRYLTDYSGYDVLSFAADESFQNWALRQEGNEYWQRVLADFTDKIEDIEKAKKLLVSLQFNESWPPKELVEQSLKDALATIEIEPQRAKVVSVYRWWAAAAAILLLLGGAVYWMLNPSANNQPAPLAENQEMHDILPGTNKAILTLADGTKIVLDSANNGAITKQGNVTIIKLNDGLLSYDPSSTSLSPPHGGGSTLSTSQPIKYNTVTTPRGGQYQLVLADGSKVWLNAASSLRFPNIFPGEDRRVELTGEGYFEIAHNAEKPFYVEVGDMEVKVLGTHFNVNAYEDEGEVRTTLLEGKVKVQVTGKTATLHPGEQARYQAGGTILKVKDDVDVSHVVAWKDGYFSFYHADIKDVMRQLGRWYNISVEYNGVLPDREFEGSMQRNLMLSQVLKLLGKNNVHFKIEGKKIIVMP